MKTFTTNSIKRTFLTNCVRNQMFETILWRLSSKRIKRIFSTESCIHYKFSIFLCICSQRLTLDSTTTFASNLFTPFASLETVGALIVSAVNHWFCISLRADRERERQSLKSILFLCYHFLYVCPKYFYHTFFKHLKLGTGRLKTGLQWEDIRITNHNIKSIVSHSHYFYYYFFQYFFVVTLYLKSLCFV